MELRVVIASIGIPAARRWDLGFDPSSAPEGWGYGHPRRARGAVAGMADDHVEVLQEAGLEGMRPWAHLVDRRDWTLRPGMAP